MSGTLEDKLKRCTLCSNGLEWKSCSAKRLPPPDSDEEGGSVDTSAPSSPNPPSDPVSELEDGETGVQYQVLVPYIHADGMLQHTTQQWAKGQAMSDKGSINIRQLIRQCLNPQRIGQNRTAILSEFVERVVPKPTYPPKVGHALSNYNDNNFDAETLEAEFESCVPADCRCRQMLAALPWEPRTYAKYIDPHTQHVRTADPQLLATLGHPSLARLIEYGR